MSLFDMKIVLVNSSVKRGLAYGLNDGMPKGLMDYLGGYQPLGICYIASVLRENGFRNLFLIDAEAENLSIREVADKVKLFSPDIVGISSMSFSFLYALDLAKTIKAILPNSLIVIGGSHVDLYPKQVLTHNCFDVGVIGEGEYTFLELIQLFCQDRYTFKDGLKKIDGIVFRNESDIVLTHQRKVIKELDNLPFPARDLLDLSNYKQNYLPNPFISLFTSRGCPYNCTYCCKASWNRYIRTQSAKYVVAEIEHCMKRYNARSFQFFDDTFTIQKIRVLEICRMICERKLNIKFLVLTRVDKVDREILEWLKKAGCDCISFGVESGDQKILDKMEKGYNIEQIKRAFLLCKEIGINIVAYFLLGHPDETIQSIQNTINLIKETEPDWCKANILTLYPGSPLYKELLEQGRIRDFWGEMTLDGKAFMSPNISQNFTMEQLGNFRNKINLMPYFRKKTNLLNLKKLRNPSNVIWSLQWFKMCLFNKIKNGYSKNNKNFR